MQRTNLEVCNDSKKSIAPCLQKHGGTKITDPDTALETILANLSNDIWERLRDVKALSETRSIRFGEETITDLLMLDLNRQSATRSVFTQTPKHEEALTGTDFECWLGSDTTGWLRLAVQAKRLDLKSERYGGFNSSVNGSKQIDRLERYAKHHQAIALYCLYNFSENVNAARHWHCCQRSFKEGEFGCTLTPLSNVKTSVNLWGKRNFDFIHSQVETIPWRCLASCPKVRDLYRRPHGHIPVQATAEESPLFGAVPRIYSRLPDQLRVELVQREPRDIRQILSVEELDPEMYDREVGLPRRICVMRVEDAR